MQYGRDNPTTNEGLWNVLYLLEKQSDEQLDTHWELVSDFLDWMSQKGYGPSTMERIGGVAGEGRRIGLFNFQLNLVACLAPRSRGWRLPA
ncbi:MAG: hypothetical protein IPJ40_02990 [Saprospirales bacterium]|nr:hypothetical protein [Saprospirales bacterium]